MPAWRQTVFVFNLSNTKLEYIMCEQALRKMFITIVKVDSAYSVLSEN